MFLPVCPLQPADLDTSEAPGFPHSDVTPLVFLTTIQRLAHHQAYGCEARRKVCGAQLITIPPHARLDASAAIIRTTDAAFGPAV